MCSEVEALLRRNFEQPNESINRALFAVRVACAKYRRAIRELTYRQSHDLLRDLYFVATEESAPVERLLDKMANLPRSLRRELDYRLSARRSALQPLTEYLLTEGLDVLTLIQLAGSAALPVVAAIVADGLAVVGGAEGRRGKAGVDHVEPLIAGTVRQGNGQKKRGGRRRLLDLQVILVAGLAGAVRVVADGEDPDFQADKKVFRELVQLVFDRLGQRGAAKAMREYWKDVDADAKKWGNRIETWPFDDLT